MDAWRKATDDQLRPRIVGIFSLLLVIAGLATGYAGLSASGFLVPAACLLLLAALLWLGVGPRVALAIVIVNIVAGVSQDLVLAFGDGLGRTKLDISGVLLLLNLLFGGPLMSLLALPLLAAFKWSKPFQRWFIRSKPLVASTAALVKENAR